jgi:hypothetical protein
MVVVRLEIAANGTIYLSAPDAIDIGARSTRPARAHAR